MPYILHLQRKRQNSQQQTYQSIVWAFELPEKDNVGQGVDIYLINVGIITGIGTPILKLMW